MLCVYVWYLCERLKSDLYPTVGLNSPLECVEANFGQERFEFDIHNYVKEWHASTRQAIERPPSRTDVHSNQPATLVSMYYDYGLWLELLRLKCEKKH